MPSYTTARVILEFGKWLLLLALIGLLYQYWFVTVPIAAGLGALWWVRVVKPRRARAHEIEAIAQRLAAIRAASLVDVRSRFDRQTRDLGDDYESVRTAAELVVGAQLVSKAHLKIKLGFSDSEATEVLAALVALRIIDPGMHQVLVDKQFAAAFSN